MSNEEQNPPPPPGAPDEHPGITALRTILWRGRWHDQGGYAGRCNGEWQFITGGVGHATPEEMDALFDLAGLEPEEIESMGSCRYCKFAVVNEKNGRVGERGYVDPCLSCKRPRMSHFEMVPEDQLDARRKLKTYYDD